MSFGMLAFAELPFAAIELPGVVIPAEQLVLTTTTPVKGPYLVTLTGQLVLSTTAGNVLLATHMAPANLDLVITSPAPSRVVTTNVVIDETPWRAGDETTGTWSEESTGSGSWSEEDATADGWTEETGSG